MSNGKHPARFSVHILASVGVIVLLATVFILHTLAEKRIETAHDLRHRSFLLATELRLSSDGLTRMVRTYVATGKPVFKKHYQDILDIRNGEKARPEVYGTINWDALSSRDKLPGAESGQKVALLELMREAGFVPDEFRKLEAAKRRSDELTELEFAAMRLVESGGADIEAKRKEALLMLMDDAYLQAKEGIMKPIGEFSAMLDARTLAAVDAAKRVATALQYLLVAVGLGLVFMLWRTYAALRGTLGGSVDEVATEIARIGRGDFSGAIEVKRGLENSVLGWLSATQVQLNESAHGRNEAEKTRSRLAAIVQSSDDAIISKTTEGIITSWNRGAEKIFGYAAEEAIGRPALLIFPAERSEEEAEILARIRRGEAISHFETVRVRKDGKLIDVSLTVSPLKDDSGTTIGASTIARDITEGKRTDESLRQQADLLEQSHDAIIVWEFGGGVSYWNRGAEQLYGFTKAEAERRVTHDLLQTVHPVSLEQFENELRQTGNWEGELRHTTKDGRQIVIHSRHLLIRRSDGHADVMETNRDITEQSRKEEELRQSEARFRSLVSATAQIVWQTDPQGQVSGPLPTWQAYTGQGEAEIQGAGWAAAVHPDDSARTLELWGRAVETKSLYDVEYRVRRHDGAYRCCVARGVPVLNNDGSIREWVGTCTDIHDRKLGEDALRDSEERFRSLVTATAQIVWTASVDGKVRGPFLSWRAYTGQTEDEVQDTGWTRALHPDDVPHTMAVWMKAVETRSLYEVDYRIRRHDGVYRLFTVRGAPVLNDDGTVREWVGTCADITDKRQAELERDRFFSLSLDPLCIAKGDGYFHRLNPAFERLLGFSVEEMLARPFMDFIHPDDRASTMAVVGQLAAGAELVNFENRYLCKDGSYRWFLWMCVPDGGFLYATARDITDRKQAEAEIQALNDSLEQRVIERTAELDAANKELEAFSYSVSHDLRAPLRGIDSFSRMVIEDYGPSLDAEGQRQLKVIGSEAQRMGQLIDELLNFSRLSRQEIKMATFNVTALAQSVFDDLPAAARERLKEFRLHPLPAAYGDRAMIRQVFVNLLSNAVKYSSTVAAPAIEISGESVDGVCTYRVKDNGVGFDPRYAHKLFGVFQRLHAEHEFEGTGVGLAIVQRIVHRHGGKVWAESQPGEGALFHFALPARELPGAELSQESRQPDPASAGSNSPNVVTNPAAGRRQSSPMHP